jgi:hypothetical protein
MLESVGDNRASRLRRFEEPDGKVHRAVEDADDFDG